MILDVRNYLIYLRRWYMIIVLSVKGLPLIIGVYLWRMKMPCKVSFGQIYKKYVGVFCDQNIS
jgi:hypothetical protein